MTETSSVSGRSFLDTNVLVYTDDHDSPDKRSRALTIVEDCLRLGQGVVSTQVLQEYFVASTQKLAVTPVIARRKVELFSHLDLVHIGVEDILAAIDLHRLHGLSFWDGLVVRSALVSGCRNLYTEVLQHGRRFDGLRIENPFIKN